MNIALTGASGLVGTALGEHLRQAGHRVLRFVRSPASSSPDTIAWDPLHGQLEGAKLADVDVVVNLAGEGIASGRWTDARKKRIRDSRVLGTRLLAATLAAMPRRPRVLLNASAIGIYGTHAAGVVTEASAPAEDFLAQVVRDWEAATLPASQAGVRVVGLRFGLILSSRGGALAKMLPAFRLGLGGPVGGGAQYWSWVSLADVLGVMDRALTDESLSGAVNVVSPQPVTSREFTRTLGRVLHRPAILPLPAFALRLALGEMADATLLASQQVQPARLIAAGYQFRHAELVEALSAALRD